MDVLKIVFHIDEMAKWQMVIGNVKNFIADVGMDRYDIKIVVNGDAVNLFNTADNSAVLHDMECLTHESVEVFVCRNALRGNEINESELPPYIFIASAGVTKLVKLQLAGYAYIKP
ncbi:DsrE family protein [Pectinatus frisingensis]|uniref:DsrE family protein n=1 Tax=Pectinatus frisingensis TaxID=865 RepID=UPI0018C56975|nr:DsrE family protein [Pectinatus frisingensis]